MTNYEEQNREYNPRRELDGFSQIKRVIRVDVDSRPVKDKSPNVEKDTARVYATPPRTQEQIEGIVELIQNVRK